MMMTLGMLGRVVDKDFWGARVGPSPSFSEVTGWIWHGRNSDLNAPDGFGYGKNNVLNSPDGFGTVK